MTYKRTGHWHLDVTIHGVRYREALNTTDKRQAKELEKNRIAEIKQGKNASKTGREFARKPFHEAVKVYLEEREPPVSEVRDGTAWAAHQALRREAITSVQSRGCFRLSENAARSRHLRPDREHGNRRPPPHAETGQGLECHL
jgi:hypothetical protein